MLLTQKTNVLGSGAFRLRKSMPGDRHFVSCLRLRDSEHALWLCQAVSVWKYSLPSLDDVSTV